MSLEEFIAEIETTFSNFTDTGDIDRISIKGYVISCLREMGKDICDKREAIIEIKNSQALLPAHFKSLILALKANPKNYKIIGDREQAQNSFIYKERIENEVFYDWSTNQYVDNCNSKRITEKIIMNNQEAEFYYEPEWLSLVKGIKKDSLDTACLNLHPAIRNSYSDYISINNRTLQTNFKDGYVYMQYNSLPTDDEGELIIPEISTGDLVKYVENYTKWKIGENLILNDKNPKAISQLLSMWRQDEVRLRNAAKSECKFNGLSKNWHKKRENYLNKQMSKFDLPKF